MMKIFLFGLAVIYFIGAGAYWYLFNENWWKAFYDAAALFALDIRVDAKTIEETTWGFLIYPLALTASLFTVGSILKIILRATRQKSLQTRISSKGNHAIVVGLSESNQAYIDSELEKENGKILLFTSDASHPKLKFYEEKIGVIIGDTTQKRLLEKLAADKAKYAVISTGSDLRNIETAIILLEFNRNLKITIHLQSRYFEYFYENYEVFNNENIEVRVYSQYQAAARELFTRYDIDGENLDFIRTSRPFSIVVFGNTPLALEVVEHACIVGQLPNENPLHIYCISEDEKSFRQEVEFRYPEIEKVPNVTLHYRRMEENSLNFYNDALWRTPEPITNIILCYEEGNKNLDIALNLLRLTYADQNEYKSDPNILVYMPYGSVLSQKFSENVHAYRNIFPFGGLEEISNERYLIGVERDLQAVATAAIYENVTPTLLDYDNYLYDYQYKTEEGRLPFSKAHNLWKKLSLHKKESNRSVADHMKMKLKYLGLKSVSETSPFEVEKLAEANMNIFEKNFNNKTLLAKMEHNRWMAFHFLQGFRPADFVSRTEKKLLESKKFHMCLVPFELFRKKRELLESYGYKNGEFEGYDFLINDHIPQILAYAGYRILPIPTEKNE